MPHKNSQDGSPEVPVLAASVPDKLAQELQPLAAPDNALVKPAAIPASTVVPESETGEGRLSYYWRFIKELGRECYGTCRQELTASIVTVLFYYAIDRNDFDLRRGLEATAFTLAAFVCWHLVRAPWLLYKNEHNEHTHWKFGVLGIVFAVFTVWLITYTELWFYTMQPPIKLVATPDQRDARIVQLETELAATQQSEANNSLRRRTIRLANELSLFWSKRPTPLQPVQNPSTEEERKRNAAWDTYWREMDGIYSRDYKDRVIGIIREYKVKGIPTGFLEAAAENHAFGASPFSMTGSPVCFQDELCQFRELAYHVDSLDQMIGPNF